MSMFKSPEDHAANPPSTWVVVKTAPRLWALQSAGGVTLQSYPTKRQAAAAAVASYHVNLWHKHTRWYAGEAVAGWRPYAVVAEEQRRWAERHAALPAR